MSRSTPVLCMLLAALAGCDGKIPESEAARKVGAAPKQTIDSVTNSAMDAMKQGEDKNREAVKNAEKTD